MEMRFRHWAGITVVACSLIGVASLPPNPRNQRFAMRQRPTPERAAVIRLERQLSTARYLLEVAERRDLAMAELVAAGPDDSSPLVAADGLPEEVREVLEEKVAEAGRGLPLGNGPVRAVLFDPPSAPPCHRRKHLHHFVRTASRVHPAARRR
jgi:hypothetical protein